MYKTDHLQNAIAVLEAYTQIKIPKIAFSKLFFNKKDYVNQLINDEESLLHTIDVIKSHRSLIQKLQKGTQDEQSLARAALNAIERYNSTLLKVNQKTVRWKKVIPNFIAPATIFPHRHPIELSLPVTTINGALEEENSFAPTGPLTKQETDAFYMKIIMLLDRFGNPFPTFEKTQEMIRTAPINVNIDERQVSLLMILEPMPKEKYFIKGAFKRLSQMKRSIPLRKSFQLSTEAVQTGFPHPQQFLGCFADQMIPPCPHRIDQLKHLSYHLKRKNHIARKLLPKGSLNYKAKNLIDHKKAIFATHQDILLPLHEELMRQLTQDDNFSLRNTQIVELYQNFIEECLEKPYNILLDESLEQKITYDRAREIFQNTKTILSKSLAHHCHLIILQHLSENLEFLPPKFEPFTYKVQSLLYRQHSAFFDELESDSPVTFESMKNQILSDIELFKATPADEITHELDSYYQSRSSMMRQPRIS